MVRPCTLREGGQLREAARLDRLTPVRDAAGHAVHGVEVAVEVVEGEQLNGLARRGRGAGRRRGPAAQEISRTAGCFTPDR
ncbi:hypothetical protein [Streptomyces sp. NPDC059816]|uniref:hypothetical protein n=1 Tax=Streptomyces sp. NPDC059816 TaxID=3346960 RepID=UPI00364A9409